MRNHIPLLFQQLLALPDVGSVTRGQPKQDALLPCVAVTQENVRPAQSFDDAPYVEQSVYRLRLFHTDAAALDALVAQVAATLSGQGFRCELLADTREAGVWQKTLLCRIFD